MSIPMPSISFAGSKKLTAGIALFVSFAGFVLFTNVIAPATAFAVTDPTACLSGEIAVVSLNPTVMMQGKTFCLDITATRPLDANKKCPVGFKLTKDKQSCVNDQFTQMQADGICSLGFDKAYLQSDQTKTPTHCINVATLYDKLRERIGQASEEAKTPQQQQELQSSLEKAGAQQQQQRDQILNQWEQDRQKIVNESKGCGVNVFCILERIFFMLANIGLLFFIGVPILYFTILMYVAALGSGLLAMAFNNILVRGVVQATLNIPVIPGKGINMVDIGWAFSRDFANLFFLVILVFIGLATILRLPSYQMKKALPLLLIMAVLVNFSGVLVGFIVDISNIVTNFFFSRVGTWADSKIFWEFTLAMAKQVLNLVRLDNDPRGYLLTMLTPATTAAVTAAFFLLTAAVFLYALILFIVRISALWTISILSPFAFLAYILPSTRPWFGKWLKELISWSFFGIPLAFFLYLSTYALRHASDITRFYSEGSLASFIPLIDSQTPQELLERSIQEVIAPTIALIFLFIGIRLSRQMAPAGADSVIKFGDKIIKGIKTSALTGGILAKGAGILQKSLAASATRSTRAGARAEAWLQNKLPGRTGQVTGKIAKYAMRPFDAMTKGINAAVSPGLITYIAGQRKISLPKNWDEMLASEQEAYVNAGVSLPSHQIQFMEKMADKGMLGSTSKAFQDKAKALRDTYKNNPHLQNEVRAINNTFPESVTKEVRLEMKAVVHMADKDKREARNKAQTEINDIVEELQKDRAIMEEVEREGKNIEDVAAAIAYAREFKPKHIEKIEDPKSLVMRFAMRSLTSSHFQRLVDNFKQGDVEDLFNGTGGLNGAANTPESLDRFYLKHGKLARFLFTSPIGRQFAWDGRKNMRDERGAPTNKFVEYEKRMNEPKGKNGENREYAELKNEREKLKEIIQRMKRQKELNEYDAARSKELQENLTEVEERIKDIESRET